MVPEMMETFSANAAEIGLLSAAYFYAYAPMQLPVGLLMDRFGARNLLTFASIVCGLGSICFGLSGSIAPAAFGRLFIGAGSSFAFVAMIFVCSHWFKPEKRALLVGLANSIGMLGAVCGQGPLSFSVKHLGWQETMGLLGILGIILGFFIYFLIKRKVQTLSPEEKESPSKLLEGFQSVMKMPGLWINALITLCFYMPTTAIGGLWGVPFIQSAYGFSKHGASFAMSMLFAGWLIGGPIIGIFSDQLKKRKAVITLGMVLTLICVCMVLYITSFSPFLLYTLFFFIGFFSSAELLNFTLSTELMASKYKGAAIAFTNFMVAIGSSFIQPVVGYFLDLGSKDNLLSITDYQKALTILPILLVLGLILMLFLKEPKSFKKDTFSPID